jgi:spermidine/putrescine transport system permease protein
MRLVNLLLGSWTAVILVFLYLPILLLVVYSFNDSRLNVKWEGFTLEWYKKLGMEWYPHAAKWLWQASLAKVGIGDVPVDFKRATPLIRSVNNTLIIAFFTTIFSVILGTLGGWLLHRYRYPFMRMINTLVFIPMIIPEIIMGISLLLLFAIVNRTGNAWLASMGYSTEPLSLGYTTIIISHVTFCFPFVLIAIQARLMGVDPALEEAAMDLGATPRQAFFKVMVPYLLPAIVSGALMSFTLSMDELIVTYFVYSAESRTLPLEVFGRVKRGLDPSLNAISAIFVVATAVLVVIAEYVRKLNK